MVTECAARLSDLPNIGYYRQRARQLYQAGKLQLMLTVLVKTETAVREKAGSDPVERPGAYFNRLLEVEMLRLGIPWNISPATRARRQSGSWWSRAARHTSHVPLASTVGP